MSSARAFPMRFFIGVGKSRFSILLSISEFYVLSIKSKVMGWYCNNANTCA